MEENWKRRSSSGVQGNSSKAQSCSLRAEAAGDLGRSVIPASCSSELRNQNLPTSSSSFIACVSFSALQQPMASAAAACTSSNCSCSSSSSASSAYSNPLIPSPFSSSSLSSFFPAHVTRQCSVASTSSSSSFPPSCCSCSSSPPVRIWPLIRPRPRRSERTPVDKTGSSSSPAVLRLSSVASLASAVQAFSHSGKGFYAAGPRDADGEADGKVFGRSFEHGRGDDDQAGRSRKQPALVPASLAAANSFLVKGVSNFFQQFSREFGGFRRQNFGLAVSAKRNGIDSFKGNLPNGNEKKTGGREKTEKNGKTKAIQTSQHLLAGAIAAMVSRTIVAPLERLKLEYLVRGAQGSVIMTVQTILMNEGIRGFWKGNGVNLLRTAPFKSVNFFCYDTYRNQLLKWGDRSEVTNLERLLAGAAAGVTATILCFPLDTIRTTMVAPGGEVLGGMIGCFQHMIRTEGLLSLYKGLLPAVVSMAPSGAVFYGVYDMLKMSYLSSPEGKAMLKARRKRMKKAQERGEEAWVQPELGPVRTLLFGAVAGACAESVTYPFEVVRRAQQMQHAAIKLGMAGTFQSLLQKGGIKALYAGLFPSTLQVLPSAALSYFVYETMKIAFKIP
ncbi:hypothetical protein Mapa_011438 [Marchantia paleacea]|nr:hypothetical protein Mapa_011438 [Marchantia paleacea]